LEVLEEDWSDDNKPRINETGPDDANVRSTGVFEKFITRRENLSMNLSMYLWIII